MFAYCGNDPVNRSDPTGLFWKEIGDWFRKCGSAIKKWWGETPTYNVSISESNSVVSSIVGNTVGATGYTLGRISHSPFAEIIDGTVRVRPKGAFPVAKYPKTTKALNNVGNVLTGITTAQDIANAWTENNNNTNGDRVIKTGVIVIGTAANIGVGAGAAAIANCWNPAGWAAAGVAVIFFGVCVVGDMAISWAQDASLDAMGIE